MTLKFWRLVLIVALVVALSPPARAESLQTAGKQVAAGIIVLAAAIGVLITYLIVHQAHKKAAITGCISTGANGMRTVTDEKDRKTYTISGDPVGLKPGDRMTLEGKRKRSGKTLVFEARSVTKDLGVCTP